MISEVDKTATKFSEFQADYKTKGDFGVSIFRSDGKVRVAVSSGRRIGQVVAYYDMASLPKIKRMIREAKIIIDELKK